MDPNSREAPSADRTAEETSRRFGVALTIGGGAVALLWFLDQVAPLPLAMPRTWHLHRTLLGALGLLAALAGLWIQRDRHAPGPPDSSRGNWKPRQPGRRFHQIVVYSRPGCHLCDDAKELLAKYEDVLPEAEEVNIDDDPELKSRYGELIPVIEFDGRERFRGRIDELLLRRMIDATVPVD